MKTIFREMYGELSPWGKLWLLIGLVTLGAAAAMSFDFGWGISFKHALFLGCLTVITAFAPEAAYRQWELGKWGVTIAIAVICAPLLAIEFYTHAGYSAGLRGSNIETASVQNAKFDNRADAVKENKDLRAVLMRERDELKAQNAWATTVSADGLRAKLESANLAIRLEEARGGCKSRCLDRTKERDELANRIKTAEKLDTLTARIEAIDKALSEKREVAAKTEHVSSAVVHQNEFLTKVVALVANGTPKATELQSVTAEQSVNLAMAIAGTGLPAFALFMAGLFRLPHSRQDDETAHKPSLLPVTRAVDRPTTVPAISMPRITGTTLADLRRIAGHAA